MDRIDVDRWLDAYVAAWKSYDRDQIADLFSDDVAYRYHPNDDPVRGRHDVVASWLGQREHEGASTRDDEGTYDATYRAVAVDGDIAVATGRSTYWATRGGPIDRVYDNCFIMRFDDGGKCREFTEWYTERPDPPTDTTSVA